MKDPRHNEGLKQFWQAANYDNNKLAAQERKLFYEFFLELARQSKNILEIGVGRGRMVSILRQHGVGARFVGLDLTPVLNVAPTDMKVIGDTRRLPLRDSCFDLVYSLGVIEHFAETYQAIREHVRVLRPGGYVLITTPHLSLQTAVRWYRHMASGEYKTFTFQIAEGRNLTLRYVQEGFRRANLEIVSSEGCGLAYNANQTKNIMKQLLPSSLCQPFLFCLGRKSSAVLG